MSAIPRRIRDYTGRHATLASQKNAPLIDHSLHIVTKFYEFRPFERAWTVSANANAGSVLIRSALDCVFTRPLCQSLQ